jgi:NAD(P)-dependent dehydrogenase (short-subunit alcohol dehydrogenase family)
VVTGASKGIGLGIARALAAEGVEVVLCARSDELLRKAANQIADASGVPAHSVAADLATPEGIEALVACANRDLGTVDILVNNAGAIPGGTIEGIDDETWHRAYELKLWGYIRLCKALLPGMKARGSGVIVNIIGNAGKRPSAGYIAGGIANAGLMNFTAGLAQEAGPHGIRVVGINPGPIRTDRQDQLIARRALDQSATEDEVRLSMGRDIPLRRIGEVAEVADVAVFLASDRASYISGCVVPIEGGMTAAI